MLIIVYKCCEFKVWRSLIRQPTLAVYLSKIWLEPESFVDIGAG